jgi:hypothetical protein
VQLVASDGRRGLSRASLISLRLPMLLVHFHHNVSSDVPSTRVRVAAADLFNDPFQRVGLLHEVGCLMLAT